MMATSGDDQMDTKIEGLTSFILDQQKMAFQDGGTAALSSLTSSIFNRNVEVNIGIIGNSGAGKSSFINALRGLTADDKDKGAANVGETETTTEPMPYKHPDNDNLVLWDLPGVNTPNFPKDEYFEKIGLAKYNYFIIISATRFSEIDQWIAKSLIDENKKFYFVRSKVGSDIENNKKSHPKTHNEDEVLDNIRQDCMKNLAGIECNVYLIDNYETDKFDFSDLSFKLLSHASELQKNALLFTLHAFSEEMISAKKRSLKSRQHKVALLSSIAGAIPIPGLSQTVDVSVLLKEAIFYKKQFCLTDKVLKTYGEKLGLHYHTIEFSASGMVAFVIVTLGTKMATTYATGSVLKYLLPGYGNVMGAIAGYSGCIGVLRALLEYAEEDARKIIKFPMNNVSI